MLKIRILKSVSEIAMPDAAKKKKYGWRIKGSRKNITDTIVNKVRNKIMEIIRINELDPAEETIVSVTKLLDNMQDEISGKFNIALKFVKIRGIMPARGYYDGARGVYYGSDQSIEITVPYGYNSEQYKIYKEVNNLKKPANEEKFKEKLEKKVKELKEKGKLSPVFKPPVFTKSTTINDENLKQLSKSFPQYRGPEEVEKIISLIRPDLKSSPNPVKRRNVRAAFEKDTAEFSTAFHEAVHARQYVTQTDDAKKGDESGETKSKRKEQLASYFAEENLPALSPGHYYVQNQYNWGYPPGRDTALGRFFYISRPIEVDARISQLRLKYRVLKLKALKDYKKEIKKATPDQKEQAKQKYRDVVATRSAKVFDEAKKYEEAWSKGLEVYGMNIHTDKLASEELKEKYLHQFYLQMSKDARDLFNSDPRYQEELDKHREAVKEINKKIASSNNEISQEQKDKYERFAYYFNRMKKSSPDSEKDSSEEV